MTQPQKKIDANDVARAGNIDKVIRGKIKQIDGPELTEQTSYADTLQSFQDTIDGKKAAIPFPLMPELSKTKALKPGSTLTLVGEPKTSKSFLLLEWMWRWALDQVSVAALMLEDGSQYHVDRMVAQMCEKSGMLNDDWWKNDDHRAEALKKIAEWRECIDYVTPFIQAPESGQRVTCEYVKRWAYRELDAGARILAVDPMTKVKSNGREPLFEAHDNLLTDLKDMARNYGASVIAVTHPKAASRNEVIMPSLSNIANGQAYGNFSNTIFWLANVWPERQTSYEPMGGKYNRKIIPLGCRNAQNPSPSGIAVYFHYGSVTHVEIGSL